MKIYLVKETCSVFNPNGSVALHDTDTISMHLTEEGAMNARKKEIENLVEKRKAVVDEAISKGRNVFLHTRVESYNIFIEEGEVVD